MELATITDRNTGRKIPLVGYDEEGREIMGYLHTPSPDSIEVVDAKKFDSRLASLKNGSRIAIKSLLDDTSLTRQHALRLDYESRMAVNNLLWAGRIISVGEPSFDKKLPAMARANNSQSLEIRAGILEDLTHKTKEVEAEHRELLNERRKNVLSEYCDALNNYGRKIRHTSFRMAEAVVECDKYVDHDERTLGRIVDIVLGTNVKYPASTQELAENIKYTLVSGDISARDRYLSLLESQKTTRDLEEVLDVTTDVRFAMESLGATLDDAINYAAAGVNLERGFGESPDSHAGIEARNRYDNGVALARGIEMPMTDSISIGNILARSEINMPDVGYIIAKEKGLKNEGNAKEFGRIYSIAVKKHGLEDTTLSFVPLYFETLKAASESKARIALDAVAVHTDPGVELLKDKQYRKNIASLASNAFYAAGSRIARNSHESWQFAKASIDAARSGGDVNRWAEAVRSARLDYGLDLSDAMQKASDLEEHARSTGNYLPLDLFLNTQGISRVVMENNTAR